MVTCPLMELFNYPCQQEEQTASKRRIMMEQEHQTAGWSCAHSLYKESTLLFVSLNYNRWMYSLPNKLRITCITLAR